MTSDDSAEAMGQRARHRGLLARFRRQRGDHPGQGHDPAQIDEAAAHPDAPVLDLDDASFEANTEGCWTVVDFWAPWCGPCRAYHPVFDQAARDTPTVRFARCNVDESPGAASAVGILSIPTIVLFDPAGNEADRIVGVPPRKEFARMMRHTASPSAPG